MSAEDPIDESENCILVEGPRWGDAEFYGGWLLAAAETEVLWKKAIEDPEFNKAINDLCLRLGYFPDFGMAACSFQMRLREHRTSFVLRLENEEADEFAMMAGMGFFERAGDHYRMAIPSGLTLASVRAAALAYAATEDKEYYLHPEYLVTTMSLAEADTRQRRLLAIDEFHCSGDLLSLPRA